MSDLSRERPRRTDQPTSIKTRWALSLCERPDMAELLNSDDEPQLLLLPTEPTHDRDAVLREATNG